MKKYAIPLAALSAAVILVSTLAAAPSGPSAIPPGQLKKIDLPPPGSPVPTNNSPAHLLSADGVLFLAPDGHPPGKGKPVLLPFPAAVF